MIGKWSLVSRALKLRSNMMIVNYIRMNSRCKLLQYLMYRLNIQLGIILCNDVGNFLRKDYVRNESNLIK